MIIDWTRDTSFQGLGLILDWAGWSYVVPREGYFVSESPHKFLSEGGIKFISEDGIKFASENSGKMVSEVGDKLVTEV